VTRSNDVNHKERADGQAPLSQARRVRYARHSAQPSDIAAIVTMNIVDDAMRASDMALIAYNSAAAQGSAQ
jgi:hypothetical protein